MEQQAGGVRLADGGAWFAVWSSAAQAIDLCLYPPDDDGEVARIRLGRGDDGWHRGFAPGVTPGMRYGFRAHGPWAPDEGHWFDPAKLLVDPYATEIDRSYVYSAQLAERGVDTAALMPKTVVHALPPPPARRAPLFAPGGLIYEVNVRGFSRLHPDVPPDQRGTIAALAHPSVIAHLKRIGVSAVQLMPITAIIDERHLPPLGLVNMWGYNPVTFMALDPRLAPGGLAELRKTVETLHAEGIGVILDVVLNHTGESDVEGPTLSLRGLDARAYFRMADGRLDNVTGCGNTLACDHPAVRRLILDALRHFVVHAGVDGFRFDLATVLGRDRNGFSPDAPLLREIVADPVLGDRVLIAEPWDIGPGGYQLGAFPPPFLEWNDRYRDDMRRFWRGDEAMAGAFATRLCGSDDIFRGDTTRSVGFIAAHDGFSLADVTAYSRKHNEANGEGNRDGHDANFSWNHGVEGESADPAIHAQRLRDRQALLSTLYATRGTILLTAGDEFGRTQCGNNNAYAQDNDISWLDWDNRDLALEAHAETLARVRASHPHLSDPKFLPPDGALWLRPDGEPMDDGFWRQADAFAMVLPGIALLVNRGYEAVHFACPAADVGARSIHFVEGNF